MAIPEQVADGQVYKNRTASTRGRTAIQDLHAENNAIIEEYDRKLQSSFDEYCEIQRQWAETDAVRDMEFIGDSAMKRQANGLKMDHSEIKRLYHVLIQSAAKSWKSKDSAIAAPWSPWGDHRRAGDPIVRWKFAENPDNLFRRILLVRNDDFDDHQAHRYDKSLGNGKQEAVKTKASSRMSRRGSLTAKVFQEEQEEEEDDELEVGFPVRPRPISEDATDDAENDVNVDEHGNGDAEESSNKESMHEDGPQEAAGYLYETEAEQDEHDPTKQEAEDTLLINDDEHDGNVHWSRNFEWNPSERVLLLCESVLLVSLRSSVEGELLLTSHCMYFHPAGPEMSVMTRQMPSNSESNDDAVKKSSDRRWQLNRLSEMHGRRYLMRAQALELFFMDNNTLFINFQGGKDERDKVYTRIRTSCKVCSRSISYLVHLASFLFQIRVPWTVLNFLLDVHITGVIILF